MTTSESASASELLINGLSPFIEVIQIGERTVGKNVGSITLYDYIDNDTIMNDILSIVCDRQEKAHAEYHRLEDLELKLDFRD